ncbi:hypothetical protein A3K64_02215 [Candidatus Micrarchaeota archaeon RBG_16_36_9]|nr:MAG: hypothetical protein A3K64_02215 [Candidatus Micrarchaeota archaeon RBG_16_36_9]
MPIKLQSIDKNLNSILVLNGYSGEEYQKFREGFDFYIEKASEFPGMLQDGMEQAIERKFHSFVTPYLEEIGLEEKFKSSYYRKEKKIHTTCKGFKLLTDRKDVLDGFEPNLTFQLNPNNLSVSSVLEPKGAYFLNVLPDILQIYYPSSRADGINYPIIRSIENGNIQIASIEQIRPVMKESKLRIEQLGTDEDLRELAKIKALSNDKEMSKLGLVEHMKEKYSLKILEKLGTDFFSKES